MDIIQEMLTTFNDDSDLPKKLITGGESKVHSFDVETKVQSSQLKPPVEQRPKKNTSSSVKCEGFSHWFLRL